MKLNLEDNILITEEIFYNDQIDAENIMIERINFDKIEWLPLKESTLKNLI